MNKKIKILISLIIILLIFITMLIIESFNNTDSPTDLATQIVPQITSNERIDKIIFNSHHVRELREKYGESILNENSLINLVHIIKEGSNYKISCKFGPSYETANLNKFYPEELVSMGQIKDCTVETARVIDEAINSFEEDCRVPLVSPDPDRRPIISSLKDYYLVTLEIEEQEITQESIDKRQGMICFEPLKDLIGEKIAVRFISGVVDLETNKIFY